MWVVPLDNHLPRKTPQGHLVTTMAFVLRVGAGDGKHQAVNTYEALKPRLFDSSGHEYQADYSRNATVPPTDADIIGLFNNQTRERCYIILLEGRQLKVCDGTGGSYIFDVVKNGKVRLEIGFLSGERNPPDARLRKFEQRWGGDDESYFFRGPAKCGSFVIDIQSIEKKKKPNRDVPPVTGVPGLESN